MLSADIAAGDLHHDERWTGALAVGSKDCFETVQAELGGH